MSVTANFISEAEFSAMRDDWNALLERSDSGSVFLRWEWIHAWWEVFSAGKSLRIVKVTDQGRLIGIAPFYLEKASGWQPRSLRFCSEELSPDYLDVIMEKGRELDALPPLVELLLSGADWDVCSVDALRPNALLYSDPSLFQRLPSAVQPSFACPYIRVEGTFEAYYQSRTPLRAFALERKLKKLNKDHPVTFMTISHEAALAKGMDDLFRLHESRALARKIDSNFIAPEVRRFHRIVALSFLEKGLLNLHFLYAGHTAISAIYAFNYKSKVSMFQTGFDPAWSKWSAGAMLFKFSIQKTFEDGMQEYDFLKGLEEYKSHWANSLRQQTRLEIYNDTPRGKLWQTGILTRRWLSRMKSRLRPKLQPA